MLKEFQSRNVHATAWTIICIALFTVQVRSQSKAISSEELAVESDVIAIGKVSDVKSEWDELRTAIRTRVTLSVDEFVKGSGEGASVSVYVPGGEVGGVGEMYSHMPTFKKDEQVIVFAAKDKQNRLRVSGGKHGKFLLKKDEVSGSSVVSGRELKETFLKRVREALRRQPRKH